MRKMSEEQIIKYWKDNKTKMEPFCKAPKDCRDWLLCNNFCACQLNIHACWVHGDIILNENKINSIDDNLLKIMLRNREKQANKQMFSEYVIDKDGLFTHEYQGSQRKKTAWYNFVDAIPHCGFFGGFFFENDCSSSWFNSLCGETKHGLLTTCANDWVKPLVPIKIRFYHD